MAELREVAAILDGGKVEAPELQAALQALVFHQCLYEDWPHAPSFRPLARHMVQVQPILAAFGYRVTHHPAERMLVLETARNPYGVNQMRLKKDETVVLLASRLLHAEGLAQIDDRARVEITTDDIHDRLRACSEEPPTLPRLIEILKAFQRKGLVRVGETDTAEKTAVVTLMPGLAVLVPEAYVEAVRLWLEQRAAGARPIGTIVREKLLETATRRKALRRPSSDAAMLGRILATLGRSKLGASLADLGEAARLGTIVITPDMEAPTRVVCADIQDVKRMPLQGLGLAEERRR